MIRESYVSLVGKSGEDVQDAYNREFCVICAKRGKDCCQCCGETVGHFSAIDDGITKETINKLKIAYSFDTKGWLGKDGCRLPRHLRSFTCLHFFCAPGTVLGAAGSNLDEKVPYNPELNNYHVVEDMKDFIFSGNIYRFVKRRRDLWGEI